MRNRVVLTTAALLFASFGMAQAQTPPTKPLPPATPSVGLFDVGFRGGSTDGDQARFERYRDLQNGAATLFSMNKNTERYRFGAQAQNIGYHDQRYQVTYYTSKANVNFMWDSIPTNFSYLTRTPWVNQGNGVLTLDDAAQRAVEAKTAVGVPCSAGAAPAACGNPTQAAQALANRSIYNTIAQPFDMQMRRDSAAFDMTYAASREIGVNVGFTTTAKTGTLPWAASFAFSNVNELALPLDQRTNDVTAGLEWANRQGMVRVGYDGSFFNNNIQSLTWDNPVRFTDFNNGLLPTLGPYDPSGYSNGNGPAKGQLALAPSNTLNAVGITGLYKLPSHTVINGTVRFTDMNQNEALLPWSTNSSINNPTVLAAFPGLRALPRATAEAEVKGMNALLDLNSRPTKVIALSLRYRYNRHDNLTPHFPAEEYVRFDAVPEETGGETEQFDVTQDTLDATATLSLGSIAVRTGYGYDTFNRTGRSFANMTDRRFRLSVDTLRTQYLTVRAGYDYTQRRGQGFSESAIEDGGAQPGLRFYDEADRNSHRSSLIFIVSPIDMIDVTATIGTSRETYLGEGHEFGLLKADVDDYSFGVDVTPSDRVAFDASWGRSTNNTLQASRNANPDCRLFPPCPASGYNSWTDPNRTWTLNNDEGVNSFSASASLMKLYKDGELRVGFDYDDSNNVYTHGGPRVEALRTNGAVNLSAGDTAPCAAGVTSCFVPLPDVDNKWRRFTVDYKVFVANNVGLGFGYWYEKFDIADFATIDTSGPVGFTAATGVPRIDYLGGLVTGYGNRPYKGQTGFVRVLYRF